MIIRVWEINWSVQCKCGGKIPEKTYNGKKTEKNQAERTPNSKSPGRETHSCKISAQTELKSGSFGQLKKSVSSRLFTPQNHQNFQPIFHFSAVFGPNALGRPPQTLTFQYRTPRSRLVIPSPRDFSAENVFWTQLFGEFQGAVFPVPKICLDIRTFRILKVLISRGALYRVHNKHV